MEDAELRQRRIVREELEALLSEMEQDQGKAGTVLAPTRPLPRVLRWCVEVVGAVLVGVLCGILSHAAVFLLGRALG
jgi:hypothetical protein